jgi:MFS family permease
MNLAAHQIEDSPHGIESAYAWRRLVACLMLMTIGGVGMYGPAVVLPAVQQSFGAARGDASLPYTLTMVCFGIGGVLMGRFADRVGVLWPVVVGGLCLGVGLVAAGNAGSMGQFTLVHGVLVGLLGISATFAPLVADTALWFTRHRGIAVAICMSGNYLGGVVWPPLLQWGVEVLGWRQTYVFAGLFCTASMLPLALFLRRPVPRVQAVAPVAAVAAVATLDGSPVAAPAMPASTRLARYVGRSDPARPLGLSPNGLMLLLCVAGTGCCVAMSMPQVHIVAYCTDLGFGAARGAEMLSLMMGFGIASRLLSGWISDHIGGLHTLLLGALLQAVALLLFLPFDGLVPLYVVSGLFGLFQGGIVPSYALVVREYFSPREVGMRVGVVLMATMLGMALGGWLSGAIFDWTGSYHAAFVNGIGWNLLNLVIVGALVWRVRRSLRG